MRIYYHKDLYSKVALLKAAYHFTDNYYVYLGIEGDCYFVDFNSKSESYILASRINCFLTAHRTVHSCRKNSVRLWRDAFRQPKFRNSLEKWQKSIKTTCFFRRTML